MGIGISGQRAFRGLVFRVRRPQGVQGLGCSALGWEAACRRLQHLFWLWALWEGVEAAF